MIYSLNRSNYLSNEAFLYHLYNDFGCNNLKVACSFRKGDDIFWSKWLSFESLMHKDYDELVWKNYTKKKFLDCISHRTILDIEVMLDIDEDEKGSQNKEDIAILGQKVCNELKENGINYEVFFSGSKSYHISILFPKLRNYSKLHRENFKKYMINRFYGDKMKFHDKCMIALEGVAHWKTGIVKKELKK